VAQLWSEQVMMAEQQISCYGLIGDSITQHELQDWSRHSVLRKAIKSSRSDGDN
jgi:hypothetical protein